MSSVIVAGVALLLALASWIRARRLARRVEDLSQMCWQLRYETGELRVELERLAGPPADRAAAGTPAAARPGPPPGRTEAFVPITALRR